MKYRGTALASAIVVALAAAPAWGHGRMINFNVNIGTAIPFANSGLKETTFKQYPDWARSCNPGYDAGGYVYVALCNPATAGFHTGITMDVGLPFGMGIGSGYKLTAFFRAEDPLYPPHEGGAANDGDTSPYISHEITALFLKLRLLDFSKKYKKKWGSLDLDLTLAGFGLLYGGSWYYQLSQGLSYMFAVGNVFQIGVFLALTEGIALNKRVEGTGYAWTEDGQSGVIEGFTGDKNEIWISMGVRMALGFGDFGKKKKKGPDEFGESESEYAETMKLMDSDGDGLSDYAEMMLGTNAQKRDSDGDTIPDGIEDANVNGVRDPGETNPAMFDTDVGGVNDGWEVSNGYDPLNPDDDDRDLDGVLDDQDACPGSLPGSEVGSAGCETLTESVVLDQVTFVEGTAELNPEAYTQLDQYAMILLQDPDLEVVIIVFGPPKGNKNKIKKNTEDQAEAIKEYLIMRGLAEERIVVSGEGKAPDGPKVELQPIIPLF
jgi:outer membrane protein OmpA-like peptidoglycan-associated protein